MSKLRSKGAAPSAVLTRSFDPATPLHDGRDGPFKPRLLGHAELRRRDVYRFMSPKEGRAVDVCGPFELAFWLTLEFTPDVTAITERPLRFDVGASPVELTCWLSERSGREQFGVLASDGDTIQGSDDKRPGRHVERMRAAAAVGASSLSR